MSIELTPVTLQNNIVISRKDKKRGCPICYNKFKEPLAHEAESKTEAVFHVFCRECITGWFKQKGYTDVGPCPICQKVIHLKLSAEEQKPSQIKRLSSVAYGLSLMALALIVAPAIYQNRTCCSWKTEISAIEGDIFRQKQALKGKEYLREFQAKKVESSLLNVEWNKDDYDKCRSEYNECIESMENTHKKYGIRAKCFGSESFHLEAEDSTIATLRNGNTARLHHQICNGCGSLFEHLDNAKQDMFLRTKDLKKTDKNIAAITKKLERKSQALEAKRKQSPWFCKF